MRRRSDYHLSLPFLKYIHIHTPTRTNDPLAPTPARRKKTAREAHKNSQVAQRLYGLKAKLHHAKRHAEKVQLKKTLKAHDERNIKQKDDGAVKEGALPAYLLDREGQKVKCVGGNEL